MYIYRFDLDEDAVPPLVSADDELEDDEVEDDGRIYVITVRNQADNFTARQREMAARARALQTRLGLISDNDLVRMIPQIPDCEVTAQDVVRARIIYGPNVARVIGTTTTHRGVQVPLEPLPAVPEAQRQQILHVDIFFVDGIPFLLALSDPLAYHFVRHLKSRTLAEIKRVFAIILADLRARGYDPRVVRCDSERGLVALATWLGDQGIVLNPEGGEEAVPKAERAIRTIKERVRGIINTLPCGLVSNLIIMLVYFAVSRINLVASTAVGLTESPMQRFRNLSRVGYGRLFRHGFLTYAQAHRNDDQNLNTMQPRSEGVLIGYPRENETGSWVCFKLSNGETIVRDKFAVMPMPDVVVTQLNQLAAREGRAPNRDPIFAIGDPRNILNDGGVVNELEIPAVVMPEMMALPPPDVEGAPLDAPQVQVPPPLDPFVPADGMLDAAAQPEHEGGLAPAAQVPIQIVVQAPQAPQAPQEDPPEDPEDDEDDEMPPLADPYDSDDDDDDDDEPPPELIEASDSEDEDYVGWQPPIARRRDRRLPPNFWRGAAVAIAEPRQFGLNLTVSQAAANLGNDQAYRAVVREMMQMHQLGVFEPVHYQDLTLEQREEIIPCHIFLKEKYLPDGTFDKIKARLVAGGHRQDRTVYEGKTSSPTVDTAVVMMEAALAASEGRAAATMDFPGAFLQATMPSDQAVFVRIPKDLATVLHMAYPEIYGPFYTPGHKWLFVRLRKAMYGCVQSALLWYQEFVKIFESLGFKVNTYEHCVLNRFGSQGRITVLVHVDDAFVTAPSERHIDRLVMEIQKLYPQLTVHRGKKLPYLGMVIDLSKPGEAVLSMEKYVQDLVTECGFDGVAASPATANLFTVDSSSPALSPEMALQFHSGVAKVLYLGKRVRPILLTSVSFLSTRVQAPLEDDWAKLARLFKFIRATKGFALRLVASNPLKIEAHIDASYGVHGDCKSHTGCMVTLGKGAVFARSVKQKINTRSSTEGELVGLSDSISVVIWIRNYLIAQGYNVAPAVVYQDNMSAMALVKAGQPTSDRTRHINIRYFFAKDKVESKEIEIRHIPTGEMLSDCLTKPLQGESLRKSDQGLGGIDVAQDSP